MDQMNLSEELNKIRGRNTDVSSTTLLKTETLRVVLMALRAGAALHRHHADGRLSLQVLEGEIELSAEGAQAYLTQGMLIGLEARVLHEVVALSDSALLLTIAWPSEEGRKEQAEASEHRTVGYSRE
ncbi:MAG: cupin domain-containing protein [Acidobacteriaceae bacterium]